MSLTRIYQALPLKIHTTVRLNSNASHHLARVRRAKIGDRLVLFNGLGGEFFADITHIDKKGVEVEIISFLPREVEPPIEIYLAQGVARGERMDFIVQKAVELGVRKIFPLITERCNVRPTTDREEKRLQHWQSVIISACEQSGRNFIPEIHATQTLPVWIEKMKADLSFVLSPHIKDKLPASHIIARSCIALLIGPEGGLTEKEMSFTLQHHFLPLNLGPRVLRTETATIAAITALQMRYGDLA